VIGEIFDVVMAEGGDQRTSNVQTTLIPAGGSAIVEFKLDVPANYILVDHSIFRTFNKGALGMLRVDGPENKDIYSGKQDDRIYLPEGGAVQFVAGAPPSPPRANLSFEERVAEGQRVYRQNCLPCHQENGMGIPAAFPPLAGSDFLAADKQRSISIVLRGLQGKIEVNGKTYDGVMPALQLNDHDVANVLTYVHNSWGNKGGMITPDDVKTMRDVR
jgi:nitrite reductase (NO-forming)